MAFQAFIHDCARQMLGIPELPLGLRNYLDDVEMYANLVNGSVASRQIVATALVGYHDRQQLIKQKEEIQKLKKDIINISVLLRKLDGENNETRNY